MARKLFVLSLDGTPYTLLRDYLERLPHLRRLFAQGAFVQMDSVIPALSSVAWATFATGVNPAQHNIFGFVDIDDQRRFVIPNAQHLCASPLWQRFSKLGLRSIWVNLPIAYPPEPLNGVMISGFLCTQLEEGVYPPELLPTLQRINYIIDADPARAYTDPEGFLVELRSALEGRRHLTWHLLEREPWDFFLLHIMETDRLHHFFWDAKDDPRHPHHRDFWSFYEELDRFVGELLERLPAECELMLLSDHGFCSLEYEVELNLFLRQRGFLRFGNGAPADLSQLHPSSRAFGLIPGRLYITDKAERTRQELIAALHELKDPQGRPVIARVWQREEIYSGTQLPRAADLIAVPYNGFDLKARLNAQQLFVKSAIQGMHTGDDAFLFVRGHTIQRRPRLLDLAPTIYTLLGLPIPHEFEGRSLL
jgi:predicted AlkP superfamily phosphohydrolase/phosphomutase